MFSSTWGRLKNCINVSCIQNFISYSPLKWLSFSKMAMMKSFASFSWDGHPCLPQNVTCTFGDPPPELDVGPYFIMDSAKGNTAIPYNNCFTELFGAELFLLFMCRHTFRFAGPFIELVNSRLRNRNLEICTAPIKA